MHKNYCFLMLNLSTRRTIKLSIFSLLQVNLLTCNIQSSPSSSQSISTTGCKQVHKSIKFKNLWFFHLVFSLQTTTASSTATCLPGVKAEPGMCITAGGEDITLTESQRYLVQNPQPLTGHFSLSTLRDSDGKKVGWTLTFACSASTLSSFSLSPRI